MILLDKDYALGKAENQYYLGYIDEYTKNAIIKFLNSLPPAQPEIVRCKDCLMHGVCKFEKALGQNGYCSQVERRPNED